MWLQVCKETAQRCLSFYQHNQWPDCQSNLTCNQVYVLAWHNLWWFVFGITLSTIDIPSRGCYMIYNITFPRNLSCQSCTLVKISWVPGWKWKILQRSVQAHFLTLQFDQSISGLRLCTLFAVHTLAPTSAYLQASCQKFCFPVCTTFMSDLDTTTCTVLFIPNICNTGKYVLCPYIYLFFFSYFLARY